MVQIVGKYQYVSAENFEDYLKSLGKTELGEVFAQSAPVVEIQQNGDQWVITVSSKGKSGSATFKLGEVYDEQLLSLPASFKVGHRCSPQTKSRLVNRIAWSRVVDRVLLSWNLHGIAEGN